MNNVEQRFDYAFNATNWMGNLPEEAKKKCLNHLAIPGTHDSGAYTMDWNHPINPNFFSLICRIVPCVGKIAASWAVAQQVDLKEQLEQGIRCLDLRISYDQTVKQFYLSHTFAAEPARFSFQKIKNFVNSHATEVVILTIQPDWNNRETFSPHIASFKELIESELGELLFPPQTEIPSINEILKAQKRILALWNSSSLNSSLVWNSSFYEENWCNTSDVATKMAYLEKLLTHVPGKTFYDFCFTLTPQPKDVVISVFERIFMPCTTPRSLKTLTRKIQIAGQQLFKTQKDKLKQMSIIRTDRPYPGFVSQVIQLNYLT